MPDKRIPPERPVSKSLIPQLPPLRPKQEKFVQGYAESGNASEAAREAGYSPRTAHKMGSENLQKPVVQHALQIVRRTYAEEAGIRAVDVLRLVFGIAALDPIHLLDEDGNPLPLNQMPPEVRKAIQGVDIVPMSVRGEGDTMVTRYAYRYKLADKNSALDKLMRNLGMYEKDNQQQSGGIKQLMDAIHQQGNRIPLKP